MKVLVTGHTGFIGTNLVNLTGWDGVGLPEVDITNPNLEGIVKEYDTVVHLAARAGVQMSVEQEQEYVETNIAGTHNIVQACWEGKVRLIFASSSSVYESKSPYAKTKQGGEDIINAYRRHGLDACVLRFFTVFGEHNRKDMAVYKFIRAIKSNQVVQLYGDCYRDFTYVQDLCRALVEVVGRKDIEGTFDLGFGKPVSVRRLVDIIEQCIGQPAQVQEHPARPFDPRCTQADPWLVRTLEVQQTPLETALKNTVDSVLGVY